MSSKKINKHFIIGLYGLMFLSSFCDAMDSDNPSDKEKKLYTPGFRPDHEPERDEEVKRPPSGPLHFDVSRNEYYRGIPLSKVSPGAFSGTLVKDDEKGAVYQLQKSQQLMSSSTIGNYFDELEISAEQRSPLIGQFEHMDSTEKSIIFDTLKDNLTRLKMLKGKRELFQEITKLFSLVRK